MVRILNIEKFFLRDNKKGMVPPCPHHTQINSPSYLKAIDYFKSLFEKGTHLCALTVTIGNIYYGKMGYKEQYTELCKTIKKAFPFHGTVKYVAFFEFQKNGQLHAHLATTHIYDTHFKEWFYRFGARNGAPESCQRVKDIKYFSYIIKDVEKKENKHIKPIHNIKKDDITNERPQGA